MHNALRSHVRTRFVKRRLRSPLSEDGGILTTALGQAARSKLDTTVRLLSNTLMLASEEPTLEERQHDPLLLFPAIALSALICILGAAASLRVPLHSVFPFLYAAILTAGLILGWRWRKAWIRKTVFVVRRQSRPYGASNIAGSITSSSASSRRYYFGKPV